VQLVLLSFLRFSTKNWPSIIFTSIAEEQIGNSIVYWCIVFTLWTQSVLRSPYSLRHFTSFKSSGPPWASKLLHCLCLPTNRRRWQRWWYTVLNRCTASVNSSTNRYWNCPAKDVCVWADMISRKPPHESSLCISTLKPVLLTCFFQADVFVVTVNVLTSTSTQIFLLLNQILPINRENVVVMLHFPEPLPLATLQ